MKNWRILEIQNEIFRRQRNELIEQASDSYDADHTDDVSVCECGDPDCSEKISLTRAEYEAVRWQGSRFAMAINHENPEIERVIFEKRALRDRSKNDSCRADVTGNEPSAMRSGLGDHPTSSWRKRTGCLLGGTADRVGGGMAKEHPRALLPPACCRRHVTANRRDFGFVASNA